MSNDNTTLTALSPLDGRYRSRVTATSQAFSEFALLKARVRVELAYVLWLSDLGLLPSISSAERSTILNLAENFSEANATAIKGIEQTTKHDVKAVEYFLTEKLSQQAIPLAPHIHLALTSEDTNALAVSLCLQQGLQTVILPQLRSILTTLLLLGQNTANMALLARTHGQPAIPTTLGKELLVFAARLHQEMLILESLKIEGKVTGAVGTLSAHQVLWPDQDWLKLSSEFVHSLGLEPQLYTTQTLPPESYTRIFSSLVRCHGILLDLSQDIWRYVSDGVLVQQHAANQVGSSTMPHKVNPIDFENAEGNLGLANSLLQHFITKLPISRLQRDLSDSTVKRNFGVAFGYSQLAYDSLLTGLKKIAPNTTLMTQQLDEHWEILSEAYQVILRQIGDTQGYQKLQQLTQGKVVTRDLLHTWIQKLEVDDNTKQRLLSITPQTYLGLAERLAKSIAHTLTHYLAETSRKDPHAHTH